MPVLQHIRSSLESAVARRLSAALVLTALACVPLSNAGAADTAAITREYEIKAAFLYNFTKFIEWPQQSFPDANAPIVIGVLGDSPGQPALLQFVKDRRINGRAIVVRRVESAQEASATQLLFVATGQEARFEQLQAAISAIPVVTVGESQAFVSDGGAINFVLEGDKVRFEVNTTSADHAGVKISAQLLKLATTVRRS